VESVYDTADGGPPRVKASQVRLGRRAWRCVWGLGHTPCYPGPGAVTGGKVRAPLAPSEPGPLHFAPSLTPQCFTKYKWRPEAEAGSAAAIVATQARLPAAGLGWAALRAP
jgi:hypothetical protein